VFRELSERLYRSIHGSKRSNRCTGTMRIGEEYSTHNLLTCKLEMRLT